ncbi:tandem-95 repeat protein, partial [Kaarinaea lacus]
MRKSVLLAFLLCCSLPSLAYTQVQKFVYAFDHQGQLLLPKNAAMQCPDPNGNNTAGTVCHGVLVDDEGNYSLRLASKNISLNKLILIANEYELVPGGSTGDSDDVYVLLQSQRRVDQIGKDQTNNGVNINRVSEAAVKAIEKAKHVPKGKKGGIISELAEVIDSIDAGAVNQALGNSQQDNSPSAQTQQRVNDYLTAQQELLDDSQEDLLVSLAEAAIENQDNDNAIEYIRKNVLQGLVEPAILSEISTRVFSHISSLQINDPNASIMRLEADKYLLFLDETSQLTTANSVNTNNFFAYTWQGVQSETGSAVFSKPEKGSYLVCVSGEVNNANDSSTDCIRLAVKNQVNAFARANRLRVGTGNTLRLSATLSIGAGSYNWSGSGVFTDVAAETTTWTAPQVPGTYEITLAINENEDSDTLTITVFDVLPVAVAKADPYIVYLSGGTATTSLASGSISTDGSPVEFIEWSVPTYPVGAQASIGDTSAAITEFSADLPGDYTIQLLASKRGQTDTTEITIQVRDPVKPKAIVGDDIVTYRNQAVLLDGSRSYAPINKTLSYLWSSNGGLLTSPSQPISYFSSDALGEFEATLTVDDGDLSDSDSLNISVANRFPAASDDVVANLLNEILHNQLLAIDDDGDAITYSLVTEPTSGGVTIDPLTGAYTYVPGGIKGCKYQPYSSPQDNGQGGLDVPVIKLCADKYVVAPGEVVNLTTSNSINASKFSGYAWLGGAVGDANDIREATYVGTTEGLHQVCVVGNIGQSNNTSTACVDIIVNANLVTIDDDVESGYIDSFQYQVNDGSSNSNIATVIITIGWENTPAAAEELSFTTSEDVPFNGMLQASDIDNHDISFRVVSNGSLGTLTINDFNTGAFTYTPNENANGVDTISYVANDGFEDSDQAYVTITIDQVNDIPVAHFEGVLQTLEDVSVSGILGATDPDGDVLDFRLATIPSKGDVVITDTQTGAFTYTPHADKNGGDSFFFVVHDGTVESNTAIVNIDIEPQNDQPVASDLGPLSAHADELITDAVSATDVDRDALVYQLQTTPNKGAVDLDPTTGQFVYTPNGSELGSDSFTFVAKDAEVSSDPATVSFNILPPNLAPSVENQTINVFAGVMYGGQINASDPENGALSYELVNNSRLGSAVISGSSGEFVYTANASATGVDFFTVKVNDGDKDSETATVLVNIQSLAEICQGPGSDKRDNDDDGYADLVELEFATAINDANSTPYGLDPQAYGVSFIDDDDNDGYADIVELWLGSDYKDDASMPSDSRLKGIPDCLTPLFDTVPPALFAFNILTPTLDVSPGDAKARFALTALDNAVGINEITVKLVSPSGSKVTAKHTDTENAVVSYVEFDSEAFSRYSENGTWLVESLTLKDIRGNTTAFTTADLSALNYPTSLTVINGIAESAPVLESFQVLTPAVDICNGSDVASVQVVTSDDLTGIARVAVTLQSPSGDAFNWGEIIRNDAPTSLTATINSNAFRVFSETGSWQVSELTISDDAGNILALDTAALQLLGYSTAVEVSCTTPPANGPTALNNFDIPTINVDVRSADPRARFDVDIADLAGVTEISVVLEGPSGQRMTLPYSVLGSPVSTAVSFYTNPFPLYAEPGPCVVYSLTIVDGAGVATTWYTQD